jgi:hypothetical protein
MKKMFSCISNVQICKIWKYWTRIKEIRAISINAMPMAIRAWFLNRGLLIGRTYGKKPERARKDIQV